MKSTEVLWSKGPYGTIYSYSDDYIWDEELVNFWGHSVDEQIASITKAVEKAQLKDAHLTIHSYIDTSPELVLVGWRQMNHADYVKREELRQYKHQQQIERATKNKGKELAELARLKDKYGDEG